MKLFYILGYENSALISCVSIDGKIGIFPSVDIERELKEARADCVALEWRAVQCVDANQKRAIVRECGLL